MNSIENKGIGANRGSQGGGLGDVSLEHFLILLFHRKWLVVGVFLLVSAATVVMTYRMPDVFTSETLILVDPQKVPDSYVRSTVTGDIRNRLGTLSQQILSATRLQTVIEKFSLYAGARANKVPREDLINRMRADISVQVVSDFGATQDLQAFRIAYNGTNPRVVAQVTNELASLFIEENLKAREQQATGTSEFLENQLGETRGQLEAQEAKLRDFKLKHIGEMPDQQASNIQMLGQLQSRLQSETDALNRAEQQRGIIQAMIAQSSVPVMDMDPARGLGAPKQSAVSGTRLQLAELLSRYGERHPDVVRLKKQVEEEEQMRAETAATPAPVNTPIASRPVVSGNPVLQSQLNSLEAEIAKHKQERERLVKNAALYEQRLEAIPVREQAITDLLRDYEITKAHYQSLLDKMLSAETSTQLEMRQKGERFTILDPAQVPERPSSPNRLLLNLGGSLVGLVLGLMLALATEIFGMSISSAEQIATATGIPVLGVIPIIHTGADRLRRKRWLLAGASSGVLTTLAGGAFLLYHFRDRFF